MGDKQHGYDICEVNVIDPAELKSPNHFDQRNRREECMLPMAPSEYKPTITLQEAILHATGVGYEARKRIDETRKNIENSRRLIKETKTILEESRLIILDSQRLN